MGVKNSLVNSVLTHGDGSDLHEGHGTDSRVIAGILAKGPLLAHSFEVGINDTLDDNFRTSGNWKIHRLGGHHL